MIRSGKLRKLKVEENTSDIQGLEWFFVQKKITCTSEWNTKACTIEVSVRETWKRARNLLRIKAHLVLEVMFGHVFLPRFADSRVFGSIHACFARVWHAFLCFFFSAENAMYMLDNLACAVC